MSLKSTLRSSDISLILRILGKDFGIRIVWWVWQDIAFQIVFWESTYSFHYNLAKGEHLKKFYYQNLNRFNWDKLVGKGKYEQKHRS